MIKILFILLFIQMSFYLHSQESSIQEESVQEENIVRNINQGKTIQKEQVKITSGKYTMKGDEILPFDPKSNQLIISGNVVVYENNMEIIGDKIEIYKNKSGQTSRVRVIGSPAKLSQNNSSERNDLIALEEVSDSNNLKSFKLSGEIINFDLLSEELRAYTNVHLNVVLLSQAVLIEAEQQVVSQNETEHFVVIGEYLQLSPAPENLILISGEPLELTIVQGDDKLDAKAKNMQYNIQTQQLELESEVYFSSALGIMEAPKILYNVKSKKLSAPRVDDHKIKMISNKKQTKNEKYSKE